MNGLREFFNSTAGKITGIVVLLVGAVVLFMMFRTFLGPGEAARLSADRMFIDSTTGKPFEHTLKAGDVIPVKAPSGGNTGYPAELCYWTADGKIKSDPTPVLVNGRMGKPGPSFCPDCGRLVVVHNPPPVAGKPPPTKAEYEKQQANRRQPDDQGDGR
jgi:hypothetical protein